MATTSNTMSSAVGDISVSFGAGTDTFQLIDISDIPYKFDSYETTQDNLDRVTNLFNNITITARDETGSGGSLETDVLDQTQSLDLTIGSYTWPLYYNEGDYDVNDLEGIVKINVTTSKNYNPLPPNATDIAVYDGDSGSTEQVRMIGSVIERDLKTFGESSFVIESDHFAETFFPTSGQPSARWGWGGGVGPTNPYTRLIACAQAEGSFFGSGFNNGFYIARSSTANKVTIDENDILDASREVLINDLQSSEINFSNNGTLFTTGVFDETNSNTLDEDLRQSISVTVDGNGNFIRIYYDAGNARIQTDTDANSATAAQNVITTGLAAYEDVLSATTPFTVSLRVRGFDTIKPWQPFDITDATGKLSAMTGKTFRPKEITYSIDNTISLTAYQIA